MMVLFEFAVKASILLALALAVAVITRQRSAAFRHAVLAVAVVSSLSLPVLFQVSPGWDVPVTAIGAATAPDLDSTRPIGRRAGAPAERGNDDVPPSGPFGLAPLSLLPAAWAAGSAVMLLILGVGLFQLSRIEHGASVNTDAAWDTLRSELSAQLQLRRPVRLLFSPRHDLPMTWGARTPRVLLPESAHRWPDERKRVVLLHELAHVARGDWATHLGGALLRALLWFNPLAWIACRRLGQESETACDDRVLLAGVAGTDYASHLLDLARAFGRSRDRFLPAPAIVETTSLERRVRAMLNPSTNRAPLGRRVRRTLMFAAAAVAISVAGGSAAQSLATFAGSVVDPQNAVLPGVKFTLTKVPDGTVRTVTTDRSGRVELEDLEAGVYNVDVSLPGFATLRSQVEIKTGQRIEPQLMLQVGELEETITVTDDGTPARRQYANGVPSIPPCAGGPAAPDGQRIGGNIRPPRMIQHIQPDYPSGLVGGGASGDVRLLAQVAEDGTIADVSVVSSSRPEFAAAALEAVRQWQYTPTLLNCRAVAVKAHVFVRFTGRS